MITSLSIGTGGLGRFGNQCFTIAGVIGIATKSGQPYGFPKWLNHDNALFGDEVTDYSEWFVNDLPRYIDVPYKEYYYFWGYRDISLPTGNWNIHAHMQDPRYFEHCMPLIRETFRMKEETEQLNEVAVHYRAGDYIDDPNAYHPRCSVEYYKKAFSLFPEDTAFRIFSDDRERAKEIFFMSGFRNNKQRFYLMDGENYLDDFRLMKRCKSFITANSSFSLFAAILGEHPDKKIVCPRLWFGSSAGISFEGYPSDAIIL